MGPRTASLRLTAPLLASLLSLSCSGDGGSVDPCARPGACQVDIEGTIQGAVTVEGTPVPGVAVSLQGPTSRTSTTGSGGLYGFMGLEAGSYTVTISGFPTETTFDTTVRTATISSNGQVVTLDFPGSWVRTSEVRGSVTADGNGVADVTVSLDGTEVRAGVTDSNGDYSISGLRAGQYVVTIEGFDAELYAFPVVSQEVTLELGSAEVVDFEGEVIFTPWLEVAAGHLHTCGVAADRSMYCWGWNGDGRLGNGTTESANVPVPVLGGQVYTTILDAGPLHTCARRTNGRTFCWGGNQNGRLGNGTMEDSSEPVEVLGGLVFRRLATGSHTCGAVQAGDLFDLYCWGRNDRGQLGNGTFQDIDVPKGVAGGPFTHLLSRGRQHTCVIDPEGAAHCWGRNENGQLGDGTLEDRNVPTPVSTNQTFVFVMGGGQHTCGRNPEGRMYCWGLNDRGQLGNGTTDNELEPVPVSGEMLFRYVAVGGAHSCGITMEDQAYCWGYNGDGQLGDGTTENREEPTPVSGGLLFQTLVAGHGDHTCGLSLDGLIFCWGANDEGQLGNGSNVGSTVPVRVAARQ